MYKKTQAGQAVSPGWLEGGVKGKEVKEGLYTGLMRADPVL